MSIQEYLDQNDVVNSIRLQLRHPSGTNKVWIVVEGESDQKLFSKLIDGDSVEIEMAHGGVSSLLASVSELRKESNRIIGIRDADFLHLEGNYQRVDAIFLTDVHDIEMMIIAADEPFRAVVAEYFRNEKEPFALRQRILESIGFIGGVRWINHCDCLGLNFNKLGLGDYYDGRTMRLDEENWLDAILGRSRDKKGSILVEEVKLKINNISDRLNLCNGHDFQQAFALCVSVISQKGIKNTEISRAFRIAYRFSDFQQSDLYRQLKEWADDLDKTLFKN